MEEAAILLAMVMSLTPVSENKEKPDPLTKIVKKMQSCCPPSCACGCQDGKECTCPASKGEDRGESVPMVKGGIKERKIEVMCSGGASYVPATYTRYSAPVAVTYSAPVYSYSAPSYTYSTPVYSYSTPTYSRPVTYSAPTYSYSVAPVYRGYSGGYSGGYSSRSFGFSVGRSFSGGGYSSGGGC